MSEREWLEGERYEDKFPHPADCVCGGSGEVWLGSQGGYGSPGSAYGPCLAGTNDPAVGESE